ncbi:hypothetical protein DV737_g4530, partial [Chaetothyriales sp. CBS 132003]
MHTLTPSNQDEAALCTAEKATDRVTLSRSPHPYHRRGDSLSGGRHAPEPNSSRPSIAPTPLSESTESGTEADDEKDSVLKRLTAPPPRLHKGLRGATPPKTLTPARSPLPTPPAVIQQELTGFFETIKHHEPKDRTDSEDRRRTREYVQRKTREIVRRSAEAALLAAITALTLFSARPAVIWPWSLELLTALCLPLLLYLAYPVRKTALAYASGSTPLKAGWLGFHVPSRFDPGPLLYPVVLPVVIAISLLHDRPAYLPVNLTCALSAIPDRVMAIWHRPALLWHLRWIVTILPFHIPRMRVLRSKWMPLGLKWIDESITVEDCALLFPLHQNLKTVIGFLTTTSLDPCELELLTTALINLLLFARSPQAHILRAIIWVGGLSILVTCRHLLAWEVAMARIPKWRFAKQPQASALSQRLRQTLQALSGAKTQHAPDSSDDEVDERVSARPLLRVRPVTTSRTDGPLSAAPTANGTSVHHTEVRQRGRRSTFSAPDVKTVYASPPEARGVRRRRSVQSSYFLTLTAQQALVRKYAYAALAYIIILTILFGPVWYYVATRALSGAEPLGWALGYAFGNIPYIRQFVYDWHLERWIKLPAMNYSFLAATDPVTSVIRLLTYPGNMRLLITAYCLAVLAVGIATVLSLTAYVEVDTRRKVFHGVMVAMLLPTIFLDPCFLSLALAIILAVFLLLDLLRASQLPPLSRPLTNFLAPYTDGRDHRGPVIVSHIFLLIGCAIPLWLALAALPRNYTDPPPWKGWDIVPFHHSRDLSMMAGVVCVGMGDAAASLVGRRFGRTKWFWGGGKSLEGSLAFAVAVTVGLMASYLWLRLGHWAAASDADQKDSNADSNINLALHLLRILTKCLIAGCGASLLESVLTSANDNVVVPVALWLLVRGLKVDEVY